MMNEWFHHITNDLTVLRSIITQRLHLHFNTDAAPIAPIAADMLFLNGQHPFSREEKLILLIALVPHLQPNFFESIIQEFLVQGGDFPEFGGVKGSNHRSLLPTGETAQFILAGTDFDQKIQIQKWLMGESQLVTGNILALEAVKDGEPLMSGRLMLSDEWLHQLFTGTTVSYKFSNDFPAKNITTQMEWCDLVLNNYTLDQINDIQIWLQHNDALMNDVLLGKKVKPGYRVLFHGPPGTGKTLTATLLGKQFNKEVYRIDLSQVVSKYIGETEKNLEKIFAKAERQSWILFFDEADALFGKRTNVQSSHDRYANQEVSYLLQRIEDYPGLLILASNYKSNMDDAFLRRFHSLIYFPNPKAADRLKLWQNTLPAGYPPEPAISLPELAEKYELNGAAILNVVHYATLRCIARNDEWLRLSDLLDAIRKEFRKEEKSMN